MFIYFFEVEKHSLAILFSGAATSNKLNREHLTEYLVHKQPLLTLWQLSIIL